MKLKYANSSVPSAYFNLALIEKKRITVYLPLLLVLKNRPNSIYYIERELEQKYVLRREYLSQEQKPRTIKARR